MKNQRQSTQVSKATKILVYIACVILFVRIAFPDWMRIAGDNQSILTAAAVVVLLIVGMAYLMGCNSVVELFKKLRERFVKTEKENQTTTTVSSEPPQKDDKIIVEELFEDVPAKKKESFPEGTFYSQEQVEEIVKQAILQHEAKRKADVAAKRKAAAAKRKAEAKAEEGKTTKTEG